MDEEIQYRIKILCSRQGIKDQGKGKVNVYPPMQTNMIVLKSSNGVEGSIQRMLKEILFLSISLVKIFT